MRFVPPDPRSTTPLRLHDPLEAKRSTILPASWGLARGNTMTSPRGASLTGSGRCGRARIRRILCLVRTGLVRPVRSCFPTRSDHPPLETAPGAW